METAERRSLLKYGVAGPRGAGFPLYKRKEADGREEQKEEEEEGEEEETSIYYTL